MLFGSSWCRSLAIGRYFIVFSQRDHLHAGLTEIDIVVKLNDGSTVHPAHDEIAVFIERAA